MGEAVPVLGGGEGVMGEGASVLWVTEGQEQNLLGEAQAVLEGCQGCRLHVSAMYMNGARLYLFGMWRLASGYQEPRLLTELVYNVRRIHSLS